MCETEKRGQPLRVVELFAGVGGFRLGLHYACAERAAFPGFAVVWSNQWEPASKKQWAAEVYRARWGRDELANRNIFDVLDDALAMASLAALAPDVLVGGFPCQDYSVAKPLSMAGGIEGKKGVLWWDIYRFLRLKKTPRYVLLENVDRLLKSPVSQRGRDFAIILSCLASLGYSVEWRVVNSAEYGFPQRRKRVYIYAEHTGRHWNLANRISKGVMARALPIRKPMSVSELDVPADPYEATREFNLGHRDSPFMECGAMQGCHVATSHVAENYHGERKSLGSVLVPEDEVPAQFYVPDSQLPTWEYLKGAKREPRVDKRTGHEYFYSEGSMAYPDSLDNPSRTILTGEGGSGASRFKHIIEVDGRYRRLVPDELDRLQGFPAGWTDTGMTDGQRAFCMGNALVVGIPRAIARELNGKPKT